MSQTLPTPLTFLTRLRFSRLILLSIAISLTLHLVLLSVIYTLSFTAQGSSLEPVSDHLVVSLTKDPPQNPPPELAPPPAQSQPAQADSVPSFLSHAPLPTDANPDTRPDAIAQPVQRLTQQQTAHESTQSVLRAQVPAPAQASFAGSNAKAASRVVYAVDVSGAMVTSQPLVLAELKRSILRLRPSQKFQVVLFHRLPNMDDQSPGVDVYQESGAKLIRATSKNKARIFAWLDAVQPGGRSNPLQGLRQALKFKPDVIFLFTHSIPRTGGQSGKGAWGVGTDQMLRELDRLNPYSKRFKRRTTIIKAIQFLDDDPTGTMQKIGARHGDGPSSYRVLTLEELGR